MDKTKWTFFQRGHEWPMVHEGMFSMPNLQGNGTKNQEGPLHTC